MEHGQSLIQSALLLPFFFHIGHKDVYKRNIAMTEDNEVRGLLRLQRILTTTVIASFGITIPIYLWNKELGSDACYISMLLLVASAPIRLGWISRHFRKGA